MGPVSHRLVLWHANPLLVSFAPCLRPSMFTFTPHCPLAIERGLFLSCVLAGPRLASGCTSVELSPPTSVGGRNGNQRISLERSWRWGPSQEPTVGSPVLRGWHHYSPSRPWAKTSPLYICSRPVEFTAGLLASVSPFGQDGPEALLPS